jgi:hypothetical protein
MSDVVFRMNFYQNISRQAEALMDKRADMVKLSILQNSCTSVSWVTDGR